MTARNPRPPYIAREHEFEAQHGLPELLPAGERILWQGGPRWQLLARQAFHLDKVAAYFAVLLAWRAASVWAASGWAAVGPALLWLLPLVLLALAGLALLAWLSARTTVYTLTDRRLVMRIGIVLTVAYNLPLSRIEAAQLRPARRGQGDICLQLEPHTRIAWLQLWPHVRPWRVRQAQPMLRALADVQAVSGLLGEAWRQVNSSANGQDAAQPLVAAAVATTATAASARPPVAEHPASAWMTGATGA